MSNESANQWLMSYYEEKCRNRPGYSLRAFSKKVDIPPGRVSEYFSGKRAITENVALKIIERLALEESQRSNLLNLVRNQSLLKNQSQLNNEALVKTVKNKKSKQSQRILLSQDEFSVIADWYHYAILSLMELKNFKSDIQWISKRLNVNALIIKSALQRLERVNLIQVVYVDDKISEIKLLKNQLSSTQDVSSAALKTSHIQNLNLAIEAVNQVPVEEREMIAATLIFNKQNIQRAKEKIRTFLHEFASEFETNDADEVYSLNVQFVPLTQSLNEIENLNNKEFLNE